MWSFAHQHSAGLANGFDNINLFLHKVSMNLQPIQGISNRSRDNKKADEQKRFIVRVR